MLADEVLLLSDGRVMQAGKVEAVFLRPVNEGAARLLGADNVGHGMVVAEGRIDVGSGVLLDIAGPALSPGWRVGWAVRPEQIRMRRDARYPATIRSIGDRRAGQRSLRIEIGNSVLRAVADPGGSLELGPCRVDVDPDALQVWNVETGGGSEMDTL